MAFSGSGAASGATAGMAFGPWGAAIGGVLGGLFGGKKSKAAEMAPPIDLNAEAKKAIKGNAENEDAIEALLSRANSFTQDQNISLMEKAMPGYGKLSQQLTSTAGDLLTDPYNLPDDVAQNLTRLAAERGITTGIKGEASDYSLLRDFGISSLDYGQKRIGQAGSITQMLASLAPKVNPLSPMSFYVTPGQTADVAAGNKSAEQAKLNADASATNYNQANSWDNILAAAGMLGSSGALGKKNTGNRDVSNWDGSGRNLAGNLSGD